MTGPLQDPVRSSSAAAAASLGRTASCAMMGAGMAGYTALLCSGWMHVQDDETQRLRAGLLCSAWLMIIDTRIDYMVS